MEQISIMLLNAVQLAENTPSAANQIRNNLKNRKRRNLAILCETNYTKKRIPKSENYYRQIERMEDYVFYSHFRMTRATFKKLENMIKPMWCAKSTGRISISLKKALYVTLWKLSNQISFRAVSDRFGIGIGTAYKIFVRIIKLICCLKDRIIKFPKTPEEQRSVSEDFATSRRNPFPFVLGCIDGTHINITQPLKDGISYYNRKGKFSIIAQAVVDSKMKFLDVFIGCPGRCHDASVWEMSSLKKAITSGEIKISSNMHLLGDGAYPLDMFMMVPYRDNGFLSTKQSKFNTILSSTRVFVEQAFGILKKKFQILKCIEVQRPNLPKIIVLACMILHNIIIMYDDIQNNIENNIVLEERTIDHDLQPIARTSSQRGEAKEKRDAIATLLSA